MGIFSKAIRNELAAQAPEILQRLKDDRSGKITLKPTQRRAAMMLLRKVMTAAHIRAELETVPKAKTNRSKANS